MNDMQKPKLKAKDAPDLTAFTWDDPFRLETQLTEEERMLRDAAHAFAQDRLMPRVQKAFAEEHTDPAIFREMGEAGLLRGMSPTDWSRVRWSAWIRATAP